MNFERSYPRDTSFLTFLGKPIKQYPTYSFGCYMLGLVDLKYGKEKVFEAISDPPLFVKLYNSAAEEKYRFT